MFWRFRKFALVLAAVITIAVGFLVKNYLPKPQNIQKMESVSKNTHIPEEAAINLEQLPPVEQVRVGEVLANIDQMSEYALEQEILNAEAELENSKLIERLNQGVVPDNEMQEAKRFLERLTLLEAEMLERKMARLTPEFEVALNEIDDQLEEIKAILEE